MDGKNGRVTPDVANESINCSCLSPGTVCQLLTSVFTLSLLTFFAIEFKEYVSSLLLWAESLSPPIIYLIFVMMFTIVSLPFTWGYILLNLACGFLFGMVNGMLVVVTTASIGVLVSHLTVKYFCAKCIAERLLSGDMFKALLMVISGSDSFKVVMISRLTPIPFGLQNAVFAVSPLSIKSYLCATAIGLLPTQVINVYLGSTVRSMQDVLTDSNTATTGYFVFAVQVMISMLLMMFVLRKAKIELNKMVQKNTLSSSIENVI
ncbi:transmembrane protein 64-like [Artemia franciscana]|uniref:VTT domain-containing protein n=1 Tax=Artemia franciscana TaxID=6661 RepID=A0AA88I623_ARTSF|nr:hypothetical protein QYM36_001327 [Artemia franciscana]KAK2724809.1 hypothetical protein QYM36_001327 [Artemia franciscana]KAK2724810.1 hypothetical protein QYM36_001327 [Artemia franciscana]